MVVNKYFFLKEEKEKNEERGRQTIYYIALENLELKCWIWPVLCYLTVGKFMFPYIYI